MLQQSTFGHGVKSLVKASLPSSLFRRARFLKRLSIYYRMETSDLIQRDMNAGVDCIFLNRSLRLRLGIALIEAMAIGVPVVASDVGACREVLEDGRLGTLVPPGDALAMANAIDAIIADATFAEARAHLAQTKVVQTFSMAEMTRGYSELLGLPLPAKPECAPIPDRAA